MPLAKRLKVLIVGLNYAPEMVGIAVYTTGMAEALVKTGHEVCVVAGKPYYPTWKVPADYQQNWQIRTIENGVSVIRVAHYVPTNPSGARRIVHHLTFAMSSLIPALLQARRQRPDVVLTIAPSLIAAPVARLASALCGAKSWLHLQDFEVEAAIATGLVDGHGFVARVAKWFERAVVGMFDRVSSISPAMCRKVVEKGVPAHRVIEFRNWADINAITPCEAPSNYRNEWGITTPYVVLYSGNIANKQGIEIIVEAAEMLTHRLDLTFVVCGEGPNRAALIERAVGLANIQFHKLQPKSRLSDLMNLADVHLLPQLASAADMVLPSKLTNMLASGRPVIASALAGTSLASEIQGCGLIVQPEDPFALAAAVEHLLDDRIFYAACSIAARKRAEQSWAQLGILENFDRELAKLIGEEMGLRN